MKGSYNSQVDAARLLLSGLKNHGQALARLAKASSEVKKRVKLDSPRTGWPESGITDSR